MCLLSTKYGIEMVQLTPEQRVFVVKTGFQTEKYTEVRRLFQERYLERPPPNKTTNLEKRKQVLRKRNEFEYE